MKLTLSKQDAEDGILPPRFLKKDWKAMHQAAKRYQMELDWKKFQYMLQRVERAREKDQPVNNQTNLFGD